MHCIVRSADRTLVDGNAERVVARSPYGEFAVMDGHAPILAVLVPGVLRLLVDGTERVIVCKGGTFSLADKNVTVLVERPYMLEEIEPTAVQAQIAELQSKEPTAGLLEEITYLELLCHVKETHA
jgi:F-type H+-transporting ATPase subunit epsilon